MAGRSVKTLTQSPEEQLREIYTRFGVCSQYGQNLETLVVAVLKLAERATKPEISTEELLGLDAELCAHTMGRLLKDLRSRVVIKADLDANLAEALKVRNHLAHRWFGVNASNLMSQTGRRACLAALSATEDVLVKALDSLWSAIHEYFTKLGWSPDDVQRALSALMHAEVPDGPDFHA